MTTRRTRTGSTAKTRKLKVKKETLKDLDTGKGKAVKGGYASALCQAATNGCAGGFTAGFTDGVRTASCFC
jgi:hypothetical protein